MGSVVFVGFIQRNQYALNAGILYADHVILPWLGCAKTV